VDLDFAQRPAQLFSFSLACAIAIDVEQSPFTRAEGGRIADHIQSARRSMPMNEYGGIRHLGIGEQSRSLNILSAYQWV
jgi:hypothetical protein